MLQQAKTKRERSLLSHIAIRAILVVLINLLVTLNVLANCGLVSPNPTGNANPIPVKAGIETIEYECDLATNQVLHFPMDIVRAAHAKASTELVIDTLSSANKAFLLPIGHYNLTLTLEVQRSRFVDPQFSSVSDFYQQENIHTLMLSAFFGFCLALMIYVGVLGRSIKNKGFYAYSAYITAAGFFFFLQEGMLNILFPHSQINNDIRLKMVFAGLTVWTAVRFISLLLDFKHLVKPVLYRILTYSSQLVLLLSVIQTLMNENTGRPVSQVMGLITLLCIITILVLSAYAVRKRVHGALYVLIALTVMLVTMVFRLYLHETSPFLHRYGLIIAVTIEAMLLAIAASEKVKRLNSDRTKAFREASMDTLCPTLNRRGWETAASHLLKYHSQEGGYLALTFIDLNKFKSINDEYGHAIGDAALIYTAKLLKSHCREQDLVGRLGGDEFVVVAHTYSYSQAERLQQRLTRACDHYTFPTSSGTISMSASVGSTIIDTPHDDLNTLLHQTDMKMYANKKQLA